MHLLLKFLKDLWCVQTIDTFINKETLHLAGRKLTFVAVADMDSEGVSVS